MKIGAIVLACACVPLAAGAQALPQPSANLLVTLAAVRAAGTAGIVAWATRAATAADAAVAAVAAETKILALAEPDRDALLFWLDGHGRGALHARGASDADIGIPFYPIDYAVVPAPFPASVTPLAIPTPAPPPTAPPTPQPPAHPRFGLLGALLPALQIPIASSSSSSTTSSTTQNGDSTDFSQTTQSSGSSVSVGGNPWAAVGSLIDASMDRRAHRAAAAPAAAWRDLPFAASALSASGSPIAVSRGFAAVRYDGTEGVACISFVNTGAAPATRVDVDIEILDGLGLIKRVAALHRTGSFAPGAEIGGPAGPRSLGEARANCVIDGENTLADPTDPFSNASAVVYAVRRVTFADGSGWLQPGANVYGTGS